MNDLYENIQIDNFLNSLLKENQTVLQDLKFEVKFVESLPWDGKDVDIPLQKEEINDSEKLKD